MDTPDPGSSLLVRGGFVYTGDNDNRIIDHGSVLALNGRLVAVGSESEVAAAFRQLESDERDAVRTIDARGCLVLPGFVNPHWHDMFAGRIAFRGIGRPAEDRFDSPGFLARGGDMPLISALFDRFAAAITELTAAEAEAIARYSVWSQVRCGTTTLGDVGSLNRPVALAEAARTFGISAAISTWASDVTCDGGTVRRTRPVEAVLDELAGLFRRLGDDPAGRVWTRASTVYLTNASDDLLEGLATLVRDHNGSFATHLGAQRHEGEFVRRHFGRTPTQRLDRVGLVTRRLLAIHCAFLDAADARLLLDADVHINHSPAKYGPSGESTLSETRWISGLIRDGHPVSLSTDGTLFPLGAMPENMRAAWQFHNETFADQTTLPASTALAMATRTAAAALDCDDHVGSLAVGKSADLVLIRTDGPAYLLNPRPLEAFLSTGGSADITTVVAAGRVLIEEGRGQVADEEELEREYVAALLSFSARVPGADLSPAEQLLAHRRRRRSSTRPRPPERSRYPADIEEAS